MADQVDPRVELAIVEADVAALIASAEHARFLWDGAEATKQYRATRRAAASLERLKKLRDALLGGAPAERPAPAIPAELLEAVKVALHATEWSGVGGGLGDPEPVDDLVVQTRKLLRLLGVNA